MNIAELSADELETIQAEAAPPTWATDTIAESLG